MILRKDYVNLIQSGKAQVKVDRTEQHNEMLNSIFPKRKDYIYYSFYYKADFKNEQFGYKCSSEPFENLPIIEANDIILDNTVIKVESEEHGKKVIEWWKEQGVDVRDAQGDCVDYYYGIFSENFNVFPESYIKREGKKIITLPSVFPEKWYMPITEDNKEVANEWRKGNAKSFLSCELDTSCFLCPNISDGSYFLQGEPVEYDKITTEEFIQNVYNPWKQGQKQETMKKINWEQAQEIIDIACANWKDKLFNKWGKKIVLKQDIDIKEDFYQEMRKACTKEQHELFDRIFGKEKEEINLNYGKGIKGLKVFKENGDLNTSLMAIALDEQNKVWLNRKFNWTLKDNILTVSHRD